jgi:hypothetical protein
MTLLTPKHRNIGSTVGMVKDIHKLSEKPRIAKVLTELFMEESTDCDYKHKTGQCTFHVEEDLTKGDSFTTLANYSSQVDAALPCRAGNCPLGPLVDKELEFGTNLDRLQLYGKNTMKYGTHTFGGHVHVGYTGWRKHWRAFKQAAKDVFVGNWRYYTVGIVLVLVVKLVSSATGWYSIYLW